MEEVSTTSGKAAQAAVSLVPVNQMDIYMEYIVQVAAAITQEDISIPKSQVSKMEYKKVDCNLNKMQVNSSAKEVDMRLTETLVLTLPCCLSCSLLLTH